jgi:hypothetical protein
VGTKVSGLQQDGRVAGTVSRALEGHPPSVMQNHDLKGPSETNRPLSPPGYYAQQPPVEGPRVQWLQSRVHSHR